MLDRAHVEKACKLHNQKVVLSLEPTGDPQSTCRRKLEMMEEDLKGAGIEVSGLWAYVSLGYDRQQTIM